MSEKTGFKIGKCLYHGQMGSTSRKQDCTNVIISGERNETKIIRKAVHIARKWHVPLVYLVEIVITERSTAGVLKIELWIAPKKTHDVKSPLWRRSTYSLNTRYNLTSHSSSTEVHRLGILGLACGCSFSVLWLKLRGRHLRLWSGLSVGSFSFFAVFLRLNVECIFIERRVEARATASGVHVSAASFCTVRFWRRTVSQWAYFQSKWAW